MSDLVATAQKDVEMYGDLVTAVRAGDNEIYVTLAHMCDALGLDTQAQARRIQRHTVLAEGLSWVAIMTTQGDTPAQRRRVQVLRADLVPLWLTGLQASRVDEAIRPKLEQLQRNAARILWQAFQAGELSADFGQLLEQADPESRAAYQMALAVVKLARQQIVIQAEVADHGRRLDLLEAKLGDEERTITEDQAAQVSQAVKAVALAYGQQTGRNEFGAVYGEMYRKFAVTSYKLIPSAKFQAVVDWLTEWHHTLTGDAPF